jgi:nitroreductase
MELITAIKGRRSIRRFRDELVPIELIREVIEAGTWAPSAKNGQQWRFTVLTGFAKKRLTDAFRAGLDDFINRFGSEASGSAPGSCRIMEEAPAIIMVWNTAERGWPSEEHSVAAAIQNMILRAHDLGLGSLWIADIYHAKERLEKHLGKPWKLIAAVALGYPATEGRTPPKLTVDEVTEFLE